MTGAYPIGRPFRAETEEQELGAAVEIHDDTVIGPDPATFRVVGLTWNLDEDYVTEIDMAPPDAVDEEMASLLERFRQAKVRIGPGSVIIDDETTLEDLLDGNRLDGGKIGTGTLPGSVFAGGAIPGSKLVDHSIPEEKYETASVSKRAMGPCSVGEDELCAGAVTTPKIGDGQVTLEKLSESLRNTLLNNQGTGGAGIGGTTAIRTMADGEGQLVTPIGLGFTGGNEVNGNILPWTMETLPQGSWTLFNDLFGLSATQVSAVGDDFIQIRGTAVGIPLVLVYKFKQSDVRFGDPTIDQYESIPNNHEGLRYHGILCVTYEVRAVRSVTPPFGFVAGIYSSKMANIFDNNEMWGKARGVPGKFVDTFGAIQMERLGEPYGHFLFFGLGLSGSNNDLLIEIGNIRAELVGRFPSAGTRTKNEAYA